MEINLEKTYKDVYVALCMRFTGMVTLETAEDGPLTGGILCFNALRKKKDKDSKSRVYCSRLVSVSPYIL